MFSSVKSGPEPYIFRAYWLAQISISADNHQRVVQNAFLILFLAAQKDSLSGSYLFSSSFPSVDFNSSLLRFARLCKAGPDPKSISRLLSWGWGLEAGHRKARCSPPVLIIPQSLPRKFPNFHTSHPESSVWGPLGCSLPSAPNNPGSGCEWTNKRSDFQRCPIIEEGGDRGGKYLRGTPPAPRDYCPAVPTETSPLTKMGDFLSITLFLGRRK